MWLTEDARPLHVQNENDSPSTRCCLPQRLSCLSTHWKGGRDSSVGTATRYGLTVRESNPGGGDIFRLGAHTASYTMGTGSPSQR